MVNRIKLVCFNIFIIINILININYEEAILIYNLSTKDKNFICYRILIK